MAKMNGYRTQHGLDPGLTFGSWLLFYLHGIITFGIMAIVAFAKLNSSASGLWHKVYAEQGVPL